MEYHGIAYLRFHFFFSIDMVSGAILSPVDDMLGFLMSCGRRLIYSIQNDTSVGT